MVIVVTGKPISATFYRLLIILLAVISFGLAFFHFFVESSKPDVQPIVAHSHVRSPWIRNADYFNYSVYDQAGLRIPSHFTAAGLWPVDRDEQLESYEIKSCLSPDLQKHEEATCRFHAVMMDAGSTGTRVHIFEFSHDVRDSTAPFKLEKEVYHQVTPGLSFYLKNPKQAAESIVPLINKAKSTVPKSQWKHTPISLKATAGLRLLSAKQADNIIAEVDRLLEKTGFLTNEESVSIMTGIDEGIFGWFTLNFLLDRLSALKQEPINDLINQVFHESNFGHTTLQTAAALDLGGGSTQVTFRPEFNSTLIRAPVDFIKQIKLVGRLIDLYTHSYLGNGLMAARLASLKIANTAHMNDNISLNFFTSCLPPHFLLLWKYNDVVYNVSGKSPYNFENCLLEQQALTNLTIIDQPVELANRDLYVFGYFFDRAEQSGITLGNGGYATIADFVSAAKKSCTKRRLGHKDHEQWRCHDLSYIIALLRAYNLSNDKKFYLTRRIHNMEVSWALGASYHLLNSYHESQKSRFTTGVIDVQLSKPHVGSPSSFGPCVCERMFYTTGDVLKGSAWLNLSAYFFCSRIYYGLIGILPSTFAHLA